MDKIGMKLQRFVVDIRKCKRKEMEKLDHMVQIAVSVILNHSASLHYYK